MDKELEDVVEAKATGEDSESADAVTPAGGMPKKRRADVMKKADPTADNIEKTVKTPQGSHDVGLKESVFGLFEGEELSEDFKTKTVAIVEAVVAEKVATIQEELEAQYDAKLEESVAEISESLVQKLNSYLDYVVEDWTERNEVEIESNIKVEVAESLLSGMASLLAEHNIAVDDEEINLVQEAEEKLSEKSELYNDLFEAHLELKRENLELKKEVVFAEVSEDLSDMSADRLLKLSESISYDDIDEYRLKLESLKESFLAEKVTRAQKEEPLEELAEEATPVNPQVNVYVDSFNKFKK